LSYVFSFAFPLKKYTGHEWSSSYDDEYDNDEIDSDYNDTIALYLSSLNAEIFILYII
jgi:hypothetical protein